MPTQPKPDATGSPIPSPGSPAGPTPWKRMGVGVGALAVILGMGAWIGASLLDMWRLDQARKLLEANQLEAAWKYLAPLGPTRTNSGEVAFLAAQAARRLKQTTMAKACLETARKNGWPTEAIDLEQALLDLHSGQPGPQVEQLLGSLQGEYPERPRVLEALIPALYRQFDLDRALFCATLWTELEPQNPKAWVWLGRVQEKLQNRPPAEAAFQKAIEIAPQDTEALAWMARQLQRRRQPAEALELLDRLKALDPTREDLPLIEGKCLQDLGREEEARASLREAVQRQPQGGEGWVELGRLELNTNHPDVAEEAFRRALRVSPSDREALFSLAQALERQGKKAEAETVRNRQLQVETDLKATRDAAEKIRENPKDPAPRVEIAGLMLQNGLTQEGRRWLDSALNLDPTHVKGQELAKKYGFR